MILSGSLRQADMAAVNAQSDRQPLTFDFSAKQKLLRTVPDNDSVSRLRCLLPFVSTYSRSPDCIEMKWLSFYTTSLAFLLPCRASAGVCQLLSGRRRRFDVLPKNETQISETFTCITFPSFVHIISFTSTSPAAINESASGELASLRSV